MTHHHRISLALCLIASILPIIAVDLPKAMSFLPAVMGVIFYCIYQFGQKTHIGLSKNASYLCLILFGISALSLLWAKDFDTSLDKVIQLATILPAQILLISLASKISRDQLSPYFHFYSYGVVLACGLIILEIIWGGLIFNFVRGLPFDVAPQIFEYNRAAVLLTMCSFSAMAVLRAKIDHKLSPLILVIPLAIMLFMSVCQSAQIMFFIGFIFLFLFPYQSKWAWLSLKIIIPFLMLVSPFMVSYVYNNFASDIVKIPMLANGYAGHRLEIWDYVSRYALESPFLGYGVEVTRAITDFQSPKIFHGADVIILQTHPHNFVIQTWIEFGLLGITIAIGLIIQMLNLIQNKFSVAQQKILLPTVMVSLFVSSTAYGMWQGAWIGNLFYVAAMCLMACKVVVSSIKSNTSI